MPEMLPKIQEHPEPAAGIALKICQNRGCERGGLGQMHFPSNPGSQARLKLSIPVPWWSPSKAGMQRWGGGAARQSPERLRQLKACDAVLATCPLQLEGGEP